MGGQMQQSNAAAATALYDHPAGNAGPTNDAGDAVMARWLQSAGLQHLASPLASTAIDNRLLPNLLMQGYGAQSAEEKQRLLKLMRNLNFNGESGSEPYTPTAQTSGGPASEGFHSPDFRGDFGAGLLDLHAMDDTELLSEHVMSEPFEPSPFMPGGMKAFEDELNLTSGGQQSVLPDQDASVPLVQNEKESTRDNNVAKIKVVVRKRPLNKKELSRKEDDIVTVYDKSYLTVHEPRVKVDLTAYVEKHEFCFDAVLDEHVRNDEVYWATVEPIIPLIFERTKATCFAYGQTGSGKTFTMQPLPIRAAEDLVRLLHQPVYRNQRFKLWLSYFEIYGGKLFDLLSERKKLCMREDGRQQVCIVGLQEFEVSDVQIVKEYIERGNATRSTGSTGANEESSRSHAILQLVVKKHTEVKDSRGRINIDVNEPRSGKVVGKISFIDLAGSERGADTTDNDRQTRIEGAEINKSLLALKECIRALDNDQIHIPFRGSKLTEVLRDSFVGNSRTVMISCISPNAGSCEHTLNTLRYADRVKSLSKGGNSRKDQPANSLPPTNKDFSSSSSTLASSGVEDIHEQRQEVKTTDTGRRVTEKDSFSYIHEQRQEVKPTDTGRRAAEKESISYIPTPDFEKRPANLSSNPISIREGKGITSSSIDRERFEGNNSYSDSYSQKMSYHSQNSVDAEEKVQKVSPPRRKLTKDEKSEKLGNWLKKGGGSDLSTTSSMQQNSGNFNTSNVGSRQSEPEVPDGNINSTMPRSLLLLLLLSLAVAASAHSGHGDEDEGPTAAEGNNLRARPLILTKIGCLIVIFFGTFIPGVSPYFLKWNQGFLVLGTQFAGGVFLGTALMHFLSDADETFKDLTEKEYPFAFMLACAGFLMTMLADCVISYVFSKKRDGGSVSDLETQGSVEHEKGVTASQFQSHNHFVNASVANVSSLGDSVLLIVALCFHSVFEGIAIGVTETKADAWKALWTISLHKVFAAIAMGIALLRMMPNRPFLSCAAYAFAFAISSPIGVAIGIIIDATTQGAVADWIFAISMGLACGVFIYVAVNHLLAKGYAPDKPVSLDKPHYKFLAVLLGVGVIAVVMIWDT